jgi:SAM-dependent methyltransferase
MARRFPLAHLAVTACYARAVDGGVAAETFDAVMFNFSLGHGLLDACISEAARVLRPGGVLFIYDLTTNNQAHVIPHVGYRPHSRSEVEPAARRHGLATSYVIEHPPCTTVQFTQLFEHDALVRHGPDRARPLIYRFTKPSASDRRTGGPQAC